MTTEIEKIIHGHSGKGREKLIPILQEVSQAYGFLSKAAIAQIGKSMNIPTAKIHGIITFYDQFRYEPRGRFHIRICRGTSCHVKRSRELLDSLRNLLKIEDGEQDRQGRFSLEVVSCMGACGQGPVLAVNDNYYTRVDQKSLEEIIHLYRNMSQNDDQ
ncbi:MAG: NAD(P)H-dependent oxidoreductase subunit E [Bacteroidales bacterium]